MSMLVKPVTGLLGLVLAIAGVAGFFVDGNLLGFEVDMVHNIVHLLSGIVALMASRNYTYARLYLIVFGIVYGAVAIIGMTMGGDILGLFHTNDNGNYLHIAIAAVCLIVGFGSKSKS